jgi:hypothetical protein
MNVFYETMANVPMNQVGSKAKEAMLREKEKEVSIPQHNLLRYRFGLTKVDSKKSHKNLKRKKKGK